MVYKNNAVALALCLPIIILSAQASDQGILGLARHLARLSEVTSNSRERYHRIGPVVGNARFTQSKVPFISAKASNDAGSSSLALLENEQRTLKLKSANDANGASLIIELLPKYYINRSQTIENLINECGEQNVFQHPIQLPGIDANTLSVVGEFLSRESWPDRQDNNYDSEIRSLAQVIQGKRFPPELMVNLLLAANFFHIDFLLQAVAACIAQDPTKYFTVVQDEADASKFTIEDVVDGPGIPFELRALIASRSLNNLPKVQEIDNSENSSDAVLSLDGEFLVSCSMQGALRLLNVNNGEQKEVIRLVDHDLNHDLISAAISPNGSLLACGGGIRFSKGHIILVDIKREPLSGVRVPYEFSGVEALAFSPDGGLLAFGSDLGEVGFCDVSSPYLSETYLCSDRLYTHVSSLAFSPDGHSLASGFQNGIVHLFDIESCELISKLEGNAGMASSLAFSPNGQFLASGFKNGSIRLWDIKSCELISEFTGHTRSVVSLAFSSDGQLLASGCSNGKVILWDIEAKALIKTYDNNPQYISSVAFRSDGSLLASGLSRKKISIFSLSYTYEELSSHHALVKHILPKALSRNQQHIEMNSQ